MFSKESLDIPDHEITPLSTYLNRRNFMRAGLVVGSTVATGWVYRKLNYPKAPRAVQPRLADLVLPSTQPSEAVMTQGFTTAEKKTPYDDITHYNNFYEFSTDKAGVAPAAANFETRPWTVVVDGLVRKPQKFDLDDLKKIAPPEERVYRMRCVEAWSMVIPWDGFELNKLLKRVEPLSSAKYVAFQTLLDPKRMPNQSTDILQWPYVEGLRMDEAMHPLTILATGIYGRAMPPQDGAPIRLVVPWKYGFKGIKSIVKISLVADQPPTTWNIYAPSEYGFYSNVNPHVDHPRWSQATEQRIGEYFRRPTLMFNGYTEQVASMYAGMDLRKYF
ncbi:MAG TPA: protein-methionine-sulfoxide reductase catalytic subunit MsrP [Tepidisphaeraceae bacterium]|nr:protein-methionine-sulfoxide reductase catalytic subunit MsrP [Tepidisphaeraceae bacterium]